MFVLNPPAEESPEAAAVVDAAAAAIDDGSTGTDARAPAAAAAMEEVVAAAATAASWISNASAMDVNNNIGEIQTKIPSDATAAADAPAMTALDHIAAGLRTAYW